MLSRACMKSRDGARHSSCKSQRTLCVDLCVGRLASRRAASCVPQASCWCFPSQRAAHELQLSSIGRLTIHTRVGVVTGSVGTLCAAAAGSLVSLGVESNPSLQHAHWTIACRCTGTQRSWLLLQLMPKCQACGVLAVHYGCSDSGGLLSGLWPWHRAAT